MDLEDKEDWIEIKQAIETGTEIAVFGLLQLCVKELAKIDWKKGN